MKKALLTRRTRPKKQNKVQFLKLISGWGSLALPPFFVSLVGLRAVDCSTRRSFTGKMRSPWHSAKPFAGCPPHDCAKPKPIMKRILLLLVALGVTSLVSAQEKVPNKHVRFLPLGERPVWVDKLDRKRGVREQQASPPGSLPPSVVTYTQGERVKQLRFSLRGFSEVVTFPGSAEGILLKEGKDGAGKEFLKSRMPTSTKSLGVLFRDNADMTWHKAQMLLLPDDASSFPAGQMRFVNVSDRTILVKMEGAADFGVAPGKTTLKPLKAGSTSIKVYYPVPGRQPKQIWQNDVKLQSGQRVQCFFYKAQDALGKKPRSAVKFHYVPETAPTR